MFIKIKKPPTKFLYCPLKKVFSPCTPTFKKIFQSTVATCLTLTDVEESQTDQEDDEIEQEIAYIEKLTEYENHI